MKRLSGENFHEYKERIKEVAKKLKDRIHQGIRFVPIPEPTGRPGQIQYTPKDMKWKSCYPKRHKNESFADFKLRRKLSNQRRRKNDYMV